MDITKNGGLTILIVDLDLRQLQTLGEIGSCLKTARENHHEAIYKPPHYSTTPVWNADDQLRSQEVGLKIKELKRLVIKYQEYMQNPDGIIKWAIHCSNKGDTKFLDEKLAQLHTIEASRSFQ